MNILYLRHCRRAKISCDLYYKPMTIVNDESKVVNKLENSLTDNPIVVINDRHMFIVQATGVFVHGLGGPTEFIYTDWATF
jgi:hypothetical protein